jgi:hypothetical protein
MTTIYTKIYSVERIVYDQNTARCGMAANNFSSLITVIDL